MRSRAGRVLVVLAAMAGSLIAVAPPGLAATPEVLLGRNRVGEFQGVRGDDFLAWQQNTRRSPERYDVYARPIDGGTRFKVNAGGTNAANGGIDGDLLAYQEFEESRSDIRFFDLSDRDRSSPPPGVNTPHWEYWPSISGDLLLFGRLAGNGTRRIILFDLSTGDSQVLDTVRGSGSFLDPGQVNGDWATWSRCPARGQCDVIRFHIPPGTEETIPNPGREQYAPSIGPDGTVVFARGRSACGSGVRIISYPLDGPETQEWRLSSGDDVGTTYVYVDRGGTTVYFDDYDCEQAAVSDIWQMTEQGPIELTVELEGNGQGRVTGQGIDCGNDCDESYEPGTEVTLTAAPAMSSAFVEWGGACSGSATTCTVQMDDSKTVTAEFTNKPVLTVTKQGTGSVGGPGIDCGSDCAEAYDPGTVVTLTATAGASSTFTGWSGACGGTGACQVTMNDDRAVTATFAANPVLTVTVGGTGSGTVDGPGIDCGEDCEETFEPGTTVTLTATPDNDSTFVGWGGACSGTDPSCQVTMGGPRTVTATFEPDDSTPPPPEPRVT